MTFVNVKLIGSTLFLLHWNLKDTNNSLYKMLLGQISNNVRAEVVKNL